jgi:Ser/Thr protein kinase RdoA (MazF antagonist)
VALFGGHSYNANMRLLENTPRFKNEAAVKIAAESFGIQATARPLSSERDQNFLLTNSADEKFVLKIANALESREFLEAQNAALNHVGKRVDFCQSLVRGVAGDEIVTVEDYFVRMVRYLPGVPLAEIHSQPSELLRDLGRKLGQLAQALKDFDHPAVHRDFHWDLSNGSQIIDEYAPLIENARLREVVLRCRVDFDPPLPRSVIHGDANDYNVLVDPEGMTVSGLLDFGDMVYSYTAGDLAIAVAYVVLDKANPHAAANEVIKGYTSEFALLDEELEAVWPLALLRLAVSACMAAYQQRQQPENEYLRISQQAIEQNLPRIFTE